MVSRMHTLLLLMIALPLTAVASVDSPADRFKLNQQISRQLTVLTYHDVREDIKRDYAADQYAVSAETLAMHFAWLRDNGYKVVSLEQVLAAIDGARSLPAKAVLLTFDDGLASVYTSVLPLLRLFDYPAVVSLMTAWIESDAEVLYENHLLTSGDFLTWQQIRELQATGLIEIISHTHDMHHGVQGNPQGNEQPMAVTRIYGDGYESYNDYLQRIERDIATSARLIKENTGRAPRAIAWPYGKYNSDLRNMAALQGMELSFSLEKTATELAGFAVLGRELMISNPGITRFATLMTRLPEQQVLRAAQVDLDYVYDPDPSVQEANLGVLLDRIKALGISHVFLQAFADPDADGAADALYFPNRHLPVRADLFNRVAWQLKTRCNVKVFAWMPLLAFTGEAVNPEWRLMQQTGGPYGESSLAPDPMGEPRLSVFSPEARRFISEIYADLATYAQFEGIHFHDDGRMNEFEDANPIAINVYRQTFGEEFSIAAAQADTEMMRQWTDLKSRALINFSRQLMQTAEKYRPDLRSSRNMFASALLDKSGKVYLAQDFDEFLQAYDYVTIMAMPLMEGAGNETRFYADLVARVEEHPGAMARTVFQLQTVDWNDGAQPISSAKLLKDMRDLQSRGVRNLAYYPDDFLQNHPDFDDLMRGISLTDQPVAQ